jgi:hypothetical protein
MGMAGGLIANFKMQISNWEDGGKRFAAFDLAAYCLLVAVEGPSLQPSPMRRGS